MAIAARDGLEGLTIGTLADQMQMSKSGVFAHFGSREDLQLAVLKEYVRRFVDDVLRPAVKKPRGLPRLEALLDRWVAFLAREISRGCIMIAGAVEYDDRPGPAARRDGLDHHRLEGRTAEGDPPVGAGRPPRARHRRAADGVRDLRPDAGDAPGRAPAALRRQREARPRRAAPPARRRPHRAPPPPPFRRAAPRSAGRHPAAGSKQQSKESRRSRNAVLQGPVTRPTIRAARAARCGRRPEADAALRRPGCRHRQPGRRGGGQVLRGHPAADQPRRRRGRLHLRPGDEVREDADRLQGGVRRVPRGRLAGAGGRHRVRRPGAAAPAADRVLRDAVFDQPGVGDVSGPDDRRLRVPGAARFAGAEGPVPAEDDDRASGPGRCA